MGFIAFIITVWYAQRDKDRLPPIIGASFCMAFWEGHTRQLALLPSIRTLFTFCGLPRVPPEASFQPYLYYELISPSRRAASAPVGTKGWFFVGDLMHGA
jgi:hypothetical protein